jgi:Na+/melibiose symporter-like transporter
MLILFNIFSKRKGSKWGFQAALLVFAVAMCLYPLGWTELNFPIPPFTIGIILGLICSFSVGVFFTIPYAFPAQIAAIEAGETGKDRAGMYFAIQGLINQFLGSLATALLALLLTWQYGTLVIGPITALLSVAAFFLFRPYPLGKPSVSSD